MIESYQELRLPLTHHLARLMVSIVLLGIAVSGQSMRTFSDPARDFRFSYPGAFPIYSDPRVFPQRSYIPVCNQSSGDVVVIVCVSHPNNYKGTNFGAAALQVSEVAHRDEQSCTRPESSDDFHIPTSDPVRLINGIMFVHGITAGAATGHWSATDLYRTFHNGRCYELAINITQTVFGNYPPGAVREFTAKDSEHAFQSLQKIVDSFTFLR